VWFRRRRYVPAAERHARTQRLRERLVAKGKPVSGVSVQGHKIGRTFWGQAWARNLESYSDYANRLPRGRTYLRNGSVVDLQIAAGVVKARVSGSALYTVSIAIRPIPRPRWDTLRRDCAGTIESLVVLLQGGFDAKVMESLCRQNTGLFPSPSEIKPACSCPDWAVICKHVAAVFYGIAVRLDERPELLFELRGVRAEELIAAAGEDVAVRAQRAAGTARSKRILTAGEDLEALFGLKLSNDVEDELAKTAARAKTKEKTKTKVKAKTKTKAKTTTKVKTKAAPKTKTKAKASEPAKPKAKTRPARGSRATTARGRKPAPRGTKARRTT